MNIVIEFHFYSHLCPLTSLLSTAITGRRNALFMDSKSLLNVYAQRLTTQFHSIIQCNYMNEYN